MHSKEVHEKRNNNLGEKQRIVVAILMFVTAGFVKRALGGAPSNSGTNAPQAKYDNSHSRVSTNKLSVRCNSDPLQQVEYGAM